jgi:hypothetical protein
MNKVIFVAGADFSGTTVLDLCLSSARGGFSLGEVHAYYWKTLPRHENINCWCNDDYCAVWDGVKRYGERGLYTALFKNHPLVEYLVDSSKNIRWISKKQADCENDNIPTKIVLIWKTADDFLRSCQKRGRARFAGFRWVAYNFACMYKYPEAYTIPYKDLVEKPEDTLKNLCEYLEIEYNPKMMEYGDKHHHTLYGNKGPRQQVRLIRKNTISSTDSVLQYSKNIVFRYIEKKLKTGSIRTVDRVLGFIFYLVEISRNYLKVKLYYARS